MNYYILTTLLPCLTIFILALHVLTVLPAALFAFILFICPLRWSSAEELDEEKRLQRVYKAEKRLEKLQRERHGAGTDDTHAGGNMQMITTMAPATATFDGDEGGVWMGGRGLDGVLKKGVGRRVVVEWRCCF